MYDSKTAVSASKSYCVRHDCQNVIERLPGFGQLEHSRQSERSEHGQALDAFCEELDETEHNDEEVENVPTILESKITSCICSNIVICDCILTAKKYLGLMAPSLANDSTANIAVKK